MPTYSEVMSFSRGELLKRYDAVSVAGAVKEAKSEGADGFDGLDPFASPKVEATKDVLAYLAYVTFFPSILSGPISRATKQLPQYFKKREFSYDAVVSACRSILWGGIKAMPC